MMKKNLMICIASLLFTTGCAKSNSCEEPNVHVKEMRNTIVNIEHCPRFIEDIPSAFVALAKACKATGFKMCTVNSESVSQEVWVIYIYTQQGYAALWINKKDESCTLEFCSQDVNHNYADFLDTFMAEFYNIERSDDWYQTFTDLLE
jgi:hypothetical protein